jgi:hypothetical protein
MSFNSRYLCGLRDETSLTTEIRPVSFLGITEPKKLLSIKNTGI